MTVDETIKNLKKLKSYHNGSYGTAIDMAIKTLEQQPCEDCEYCIHTYGTLGCCDMVNNEWVYDCEFGKEQYKKEHESQPCGDCISREAEADYIAEYIKEKRPELIDTLDFHAWKLHKKTLNIVSDLVGAICELYGNTEEDDEETKV